MRRFQLLYPLALLAITANLFAQEAQPFTLTHQIESVAFGTERTVTVYLPPAYYRYPDDRYAITYVLDGQYPPFIDAVTKAIAYNANAGKITNTIVVGIHSENRGREFTDNLEPGGNQNGRAVTLRQHLRAEVFPLVDSLYPDALPLRTLVGHSSGGLFVLSTLFGSYSDLFTSYVAIGPALRPGNNRVLETAAARLAFGPMKPKFVYAATGSVGPRERLFTTATKRLDSLLVVYPGNGLRWQHEQLMGFDHWSVVLPAVVSGLLAQTRTLRVDQARWEEWSVLPPATMIARVDSFYRRAEADFGYRDIPSAGYLNNVAEVARDEGRTAQALAIYDWAVAEHPTSVPLIRNQGALYAATGDLARARVAFLAARALLPAQRESLGEEAHAAYAEDLAERLATLKE